MEVVHRAPTWDEARPSFARVAPPMDPYPYDAHARSHRTRQSRGRNGCLLALGIASLMAVATLVLALILATTVVQPMIHDAAVEHLRDGVRDEVSRQISSQVGDAPAGEVVLTESELNERIASGGGMGPINDVNVRMTSEGLIVNLSAYGANGTYRAHVHEQGGSVVLSGSPMEGALARIIPEGELEETVNAEIAAALSDAGFYVEEVAMTDGALVLRVVQ